IKTFISQKKDLLILNLVQTSSADVIVNLVKEAGIPTVLINREPSKEHLAMYDKMAYVGADASQSGSFQGEIILETPNKGDINGDGVISYIMIQGDPENIDAKLRTEYSIKALTDAGVKVEQLDMQRGDWKQERGQEITSTDLAKFGDKVEVIFCNNDAMALGAAQAIKAANRTVGKDIYLVGVDALPECKDMVKAGTMTGTVFNDHVSQSHKAAEVLGMLAAGKPVEDRYIVDYVKVVK
ncbi:MAG: substrate-binding domain-containing protein, partial [Angelakisella sp.]